MTSKFREPLAQKLADRSATVGVIGLGYVGLPLAVTAGRGGFTIIGFDIDEQKTADIGRGISYIDAVDQTELSELVSAGRLTATANFGLLADCDVIIICVPTPLSRNREPDLSFVELTGREIAATLKPGQLIVLESTTYPGTTEDLLRPILEYTGLRSGIDFFMGFSPEREDPGNKAFETMTIPKVVAGDGEDASALVKDFYGAVVKTVVCVSAPRVAEAVKITENVFRSVNIALVNELKVIYDAMGINVWEVIDAAATKPFGFMPFYPGPGLGGHCIPIDPFYLTWKSREFNLPTRFIELSGEVNLSMPQYVTSKLEKTLDEKLGKSLGSSNILIIGVAYKKNVSDIRESPAFAVMELLNDRKTQFSFHDPHVARIPITREHSEFNGLCSVDLTPETISGFDAALIITDHDAIEYAELLEHSKIVVDTRNAMYRRGLMANHVVRA